MDRVLSLSLFLYPLLQFPDPNITELNGTMVTLQHHGTLGRIVVTKLSTCRSLNGHVVVNLGSI
jgi:hypothetical protein